MVESEAGALERDRGGWERPWGELPIKFIAALIAGVLVELLFAAGRDLPPVRALDRFGKDAVFRALAAESASSGATGGRFVFVDIDDSSLQRWGKLSGADARPEIVRLVAALRRSAAKIIVLDIFFDYRSGVPNPLIGIMATGKVPVVAVADVLPTGSSGMAGLAASYQAISEQPPQGLTLATAEFGAEDGETSSRFVFHCVDAGARSILLPGVAEAVQAVVAPGDGAGQNEAASCRQGYSTDPIMFVLPWQQYDRSVTRSLVKEISAADLRWDSADLQDAIVMVGQTHAGASDDIRRTPLGMMPGAFIHLNAIAGSQIIGVHREPDVWLEAALLLIVVAIVAAINQAYWIVHVGFIREATMVRSLRGFSLFLLDTGWFLVVNSVAIVAVVAWTVAMGKVLLAQGMITGTFVPAAAVILESALELGRPSMFWLDQVAEMIWQLPRRFRGRGGVAVAAGALLLGAGLFGAGSAEAANDETARLRLEGSTRGADVVIERFSDAGVVRISGAQSLSLMAGDVVRVTKPGGAAEVIGVASRRSVGRVTYGHPVRIEADEERRPDGLQREQGGTRAEVPSPITPTGPMPMMPTSRAHSAPSQMAVQPSTSAAGHR